MLYDIIKWVFVGAAIVMIIIGLAIRSSKSKKDKK
jgi:hypothetical protein